METLQLTTSSVPPLITSILLLLVAVATAIVSRGSRVGQYYIFWVLSLATWLFFAANFYGAETPERAMDFVLGAHVGISFIPVAGLHFALVATNHRLSRSPLMTIAWLLSFVHIFAILTTDLVVTGMHEYSWGFYPVYGIGGWIFVAWFTVLYYSAAWVMYSALRNAAPGSSARKRYLGLLVTYGISVMGSLDFLPTIGIDYFPLGWLPVLVYSISAMYLINRYPLTDIGSAYTSEQVINSVGNGLLIVDQDYVVRLANPAIKDLLNIDPVEITGKSLELALPTDMLGYRIHELLQAGKNVITDIPISNDHSGKWQVIKVMINEVHNEIGARVGFLCILQDVTESRRSRSDLEALVTQRTHELEAMRDRALEANQAKSVFLASMSHELRTPLNAIIGYSEMLAEDYDDLSKDVVLEDLGKIQASARHLLGLINNILDLSKIEAGKMEVHNEIIDLSVLVQDVSATINPMMKRNDNRFIVEHSDSVGEVEADAIKLKQILLNLLSNAAKFTQNGEVVLGINRNGSGHVIFTVRDTGVGIRDEEIGRLFTDYQQSSVTAGKYGGTGLGLAIVQRFVELMGGSIDLQSKPGSGTEFTIILHRQS